MSDDSAGPNVSKAIYDRLMRDIAQSAGANGLDKTQLLHTIYGAILHQTFDAGISLAEAHTSVDMIHRLWLHKRRVK